jgi:pimeloyl-ACP methyl ester carboxylesterase
VPAPARARGAAPEGETTIVPDVLLIHGQPGSADDWRAIRAAIGSRARTLAYTRPGWDGRSRSTGLRGNAAAALSELDRAGAERAIVVGHSFGGAVAAELALAAPGRVEALVLIAPAANADALDALDRALGAPLLGPLLSTGIFLGAGVTLEIAPLRELVGRSIGVPPAYLAELRSHAFSTTAWRSFVAEQRVMIERLPALERQLGKITAPTLIIEGAADQVVPVASARHLAQQIPGSRLELIAGGRHLITQSHPEWIATAILGFALDGGGDRA